MFGKFSVGRLLRTLVLPLSSSRVLLPQRTRLRIKATIAFLHVDERVTSLYGPIGPINMLSNIGKNIDCTFLRKICWVVSAGRRALARTGPEERRRMERFGKKERIREGIVGDSERWVAPGGSTRKRTRSRWLYDPCSISARARMILSRRRRRRALPRVRLVKYPLRLCLRPTISGNSALARANVTLYYCHMLFL